MAADGLFLPTLAPASLRAAVSERAWLQAMLDAERALAAAQARAGLVPTEAAAAIAAACRAERFDAETLALAARRTGNPVEPLVRQLRDVLDGDAARYVHQGATSQDVLDTAAMLVARGALDLVLADLDGLARACAALAESHRDTLLAGRTLLQQALPTTFGLKAAGWLVSLLEARRPLVVVRRERLAAQLGGAVGTLAAFGERGPEVLRLYCQELRLEEPVLPWHGLRGRVAELAASLDLVAGTLAKIALDLVLLAQTEVGEVAGDPAGGSSTLPHKRNPVAATLTRACARQVHALAAGLAGGLEHEHERAAGAWHAEWRPLADALALCGGAAAWTREACEQLAPDARRMRTNLELTGGLLMAERVAFRLAEDLGSGEAQELVRAAGERALVQERSFRDELLADERVRSRLTAEELDRALDPATYLGATRTFVERALRLYRRELGAAGA